MWGCTPLMVDAHTTWKAETRHVRELKAQGLPGSSTDVSKRVERQRRTTARATDPLQNSTRRTRRTCIAVVADSVAAGAAPSAEDCCERQREDGWQIEASALRQRPPHTEGCASAVLAVPCTGCETGPRVLLDRAIEWFELAFRRSGTCEEKVKVVLRDEFGSCYVPAPPKSAPARDAGGIASSSLKQPICQYRTLYSTYPFRLPPRSAVSIGVIMVMLQLERQVAVSESETRRNKPQAAAIAVQSIRATLMFSI
eukprot:1113018-Rhodomonas_salina.2